MGDDGLLHRCSQTVPQVLPVADLHRFGCALSDRFGVGGGAVAADDLGAGMLAQPRGERGGLALGQHIDPAVGDGINSASISMVA